jgi:hypothetical protein
MLCSHAVTTVPLGSFVHCIRMYFQNFHAGNERALRMFVYQLKERSTVKKEKNRLNLVRGRVMGLL